MTFVLIHGGGATGRFWDRLVPLLPAPAVAVDLPGRGRRPADLGTITVEDEVAAVVTDVEREAPAGPLVVVAHSSGGLPVPGAVAALGGRVERIVLNAALVPPEGGCGVECMQPRHRDGLVEAVAAIEASGGPPITLPGPPDDLERARRSYGGDPLSDDDLAFVVDPARSVPDTIHHYFQPVHWSLAAGVPVTYIRNGRDRPIPPDLQDQLIANLPGEPRVAHLDTGHLAAVTHPRDLAALVIDGR